MNADILLIYSLTTGLLVLDHLQAGQFSFSRASFSGLILGFLLGCPVQGALGGVAVETVYANFLPLGGSIPPNGAVGGALVAATFSLSGSLPEAFFFGIASGIVYSRLDSFLRRKRSSWNGRIETEIKNGKFRPALWVLKSLLQEFFLAAAYVFIFTKTVHAVLPAIPGKLGGVFFPVMFFMSVCAALFSIAGRFLKQAGRA